MSLMNETFAQIAGLENADENQVIVVSPEQAAEVVADLTIAEAQNEIQVAEAQLDKAEAQIEVVEDKLEDLQEQIAGMEAMMGNVTPFNAAMMHAHFARANKISNAWAKPADRFDVMGAESLSDASTAELRARAGVEAFKDRAKAAGAAIKKFFVDLYNSFIAFFQGIFNKFKGFEQKANAAKSSLASKTAKEGEISVPAAAGWLKADGSFEGTPSTAVVKALAGVETAAKAADGKAAVSGIEAAVNGLKGMGSASSTSSSESTETFKVTVGTGHFSVTSPKTEAGFGAVNVTGLSGGEAGKTAALSKSRLGTLLGDVAAEAKKLQHSKLDSKALVAQRDKTIATLERMAAEDKEDASKDIAGIKAAVKAGLKLQKGALGVAGQLLAAQLALVNAHF